ncbi:MAG TPA: DUF3106 domain-containing protein [Verrucomicrobiae bacterium]|nr:DUF3106 domain-containing protein [Verrucomicrobiae bacterium]
MIRWRTAFFCLAAGMAVFSATAQTPPTPTLAPPMPPPVQSPVKIFRELLTLSPAERNNALTNRTPESRARIMAKVREYQKLDANERELRLRATDLRWYLTPLLRTAPAERAQDLAQVPPELRGLVESRLTQWDLLPPALQKEFLDNDHALRYFAHVETTNTTAVSPEARKISEQFNQFFELTDAEKQQALGTLSEGERAAMEKTLQSFGQLPLQQRVQCVRNYAKFAGMSGPERAEFLKNAEHWSQMSPAERQSWRDLVANVPQWPPLPMQMPAEPPPLPPHTLSKPARAAVATN